MHVSVYVRECMPVCMSMSTWMHVSKYVCMYVGVLDTKSSAKYLTYKDNYGRSKMIGHERSNRALIGCDSQCNATRRRALPSEQQRSFVHINTTTHRQRQSQIRIPDPHLGT